LSRTPGSLRRLPPRFGQHSREILQEYGLNADQVQALIEAGVVVETRRRD
jgi:formyl-CoA transferase